MARTGYVGIIKSSRKPMRAPVLVTLVLLLLTADAPSSQQQARWENALWPGKTPSGLNHYGLEAHRLDSGWKPGFRLKPTESSTLEA